MFASFFQSTPIVHCFENSKSFESSRYYLNALRLKKNELEGTESNTDAESTDDKKYQKYLVISRLIDLLDKYIADFDNISAANKQPSNLTNELLLSKTLADCCLEVLGSDYQLLVKPRNDNRKIADNGVKWGSAGIAVGAATLMPVSLVGVVVIGGILVTGQAARYLMGTNDPRASSAYLLVELTRSFLAAHGELQKQDNLHKQIILQNALDVFGLSADCEREALNARYQQLSVSCNPESHPELEQEFNKLNDAYDILLQYTEKRTHAQEDEENNVEQLRLR